MEKTEQIGLFVENEIENRRPIEVVESVFVKAEKTDWRELFKGFDELYAITFSSGIDFTNEMLSLFKYAEVIFGNDKVINQEIKNNLRLAVVENQKEIIKRISKSKSSAEIAGRMEKNEIKLYVPKMMKSHEKVFILKKYSGESRIVVGSANMSYSAFGGLQRENITKYDNDENALTYYWELFEEFRDTCTNELPSETLSAAIKSDDYFDDNPDNIPIIEEVKKNKIVIIQDIETDDDFEISANLDKSIKDLKPYIKNEKQNSKKVLMLDADFIKTFSRAKRDYSKSKKIKEIQLPKLHLDYETDSININNKPVNMNPSPEHIKNDMNSFTEFMDSYNRFIGDIEKNREAFYKYAVWYFASPFMPYLRYVGNMNNYPSTDFPVFSAIYGDSNGGKSTFIELLSKMMYGEKVLPTDSTSFTQTKLAYLKTNCEGLPIYIDDLPYMQYQQNYEKVIKDDEFGFRDMNINYPAICFTTNKVPSFTSDITKRMVMCYIDMTVRREDAAKLAKGIKENISTVTNSFFVEYAKRMFSKVEYMIDNMKKGDRSYFPDIFKCSSELLLEMFHEYVDTVPSYVKVYTYDDYLGAKAQGQAAINRIIQAIEKEPESFSIDRKNKQLIYSYPEKRAHELKYLKNELPPELKVQVLSRTATMDLDAAKEVFGKKFWKVFKRIY